MSSITNGSLNDVMQRDKNKKDFSVNGKCSNCGGCCNDIIPLTNADINRIKNYVKKNNIKPIWHGANYLVKETLDTVCPFRDENTQTCIIYKVRPTICRLYFCHKIDKKEMLKHTELKGIGNSSMRQKIFGEDFYANKNYKKLS